MPLEGVEPRRVADAVEQLRLRELPVDECDGVTPGREHAREVLRRRRRRVEDVRRDEVDYLPEDGARGSSCAQVQIGVVATARRRLPPRDAFAVELPILG